MLDLNYVVEHTEHVQELLRRKEYDVDLNELVSLIKEKNKLIVEVESNKALQNKLSKSVPQVKKEGGDVASIFKQVKKLGEQNKERETRLAELEEKINKIAFALPNLPDEDILTGGKENNKTIY